VIVVGATNLSEHSVHRLAVQYRKVQCSALNVKGASASRRQSAADVSCQLRQHVIPALASTSSCAGLQAQCSVQQGPGFSESAADIGVVMQPEDL
jgi:hypothetical protein